MRSHLLNLLILAISTSAMIYLYGQIDYTSQQFSTWDLHEYRKMAAASPHVDAEVRQPFAYRILGPYLVGLVPLPNLTTFYLFAIVASYAVVGLLYGFFSFAGLSPSMAAIATFLFTTNRYFFGLTIWDYFQLDDLLSHLFLIALFWSMLANRWGVFAIALCLGALTRETGMLMIPVGLFYLLEKSKWHTQGLRFVLAVIPAIVAFLLVRMLVPTAGGETLLQALRANAAKMISLESLYRLLVNAFIPLTLLPLVFLDVTVQFFKDRKYAFVFVVLVLISTCFGNNLERLMAPTFIVFYWLIGTILQKYQWNWISLAMLIVTCAVASLHHSIARYLLPNKEVTMILSLVTLAAVTALAVAVRISRRGTGRTA
jgi:hypothetical protein